MILAVSIFIIFHVHGLSRVWWIYDKVMVVSIIDSYLLDDTRRGYICSGLLVLFAMVAPICWMVSQDLNSSSHDLHIFDFDSNKVK